MPKLNLSWTLCDQSMSSVKQLIGVCRKEKKKKLEYFWRFNAAAMGNKLAKYRVGFISTASRQTKHLATMFRFFIKSTIVQKCLNISRNRECQFLEKIQMSKEFNGCFMAPLHHHHVGYAIMYLWWWDFKFTFVTSWFTSLFSVYRKI